MKKKTVFKPRNRIEGEIVKEAQAGNTEAALDLARCGRKRTTLERAVQNYVLAENCLKKYPFTNGPKSADDAKAFLEKWLDIERLTELPCDIKRSLSGNAWRVVMEACPLCRLFLDALNRGDVEALRGVVREVEDSKKRRGYADPLRADVLFLKKILNPGETMTANELAVSLVNRKNSADVPEVPTNDSHSRLRRVAKRLAFPIAKDKTGRPKKGDR